MTRAQRHHARQQRALLRLRRAAVRYSVVGDDDSTDGDPDALAFAFAALGASCDSYRETLTARELRALLKVRK